MKSPAVSTTCLSSNARHSRRWLRISGAVLVGIAALTALAGTETYEYDAAGRLRKVTSDAGSITTYTLDAAGNRTTVVTGTDTVAPTVPTGLAGTPNANPAVVLTWNPSTDPEPSAGFGGYRLFRNGTALPDLPGTATTFTDTGVAGSTTYSYSIAAYDSVGHVSAQSTAIPVTTPAVIDRTPPQAPGSFVATALSATGARLTWTTPWDNVGVTSYFIDRCTGVNCSSNYTAVGTWTSGPLQMDDLSLSPTTTYGYRIVARDAAANTSPASTASVTTPADTTKPTVPGSPAAAATGVSSIHLSWTAATDNVGVVGYMIQRCSGSGCTTFTTINGTPITALAYDDTGLTGGTLYRYKIKARDAAGNLSDDTATPIVSDTTTPNAPASITIPPSNNTTGSYTISWTLNGGGTGVTYELQESKNDPLFNNPGLPYTTTSTSYGVTGKTDGTYSYRVRGCVNGTRCSGYTTGSSSVTVVLTPVAPTSITVPTGSLDGSIALSWTSVSNATSYKVLEATNSSFTGATQVFSAPGTSTSLSGRTDGNYWYEVQACNSTGCGGFATGGPTLVTRAPAAPASISISSPTNTGSFTISWGAVTSGTATRYELYEATNSSFTGEVKVDDKNGFSSTLSSHAQGSYWYRVRGCNQTNCGATTAVASPQLVDTTIPGAPGNVRTAGAPSQSTAVLNWDAASDNLSGIGSYEWRLTTTPTFTNAGNVLSVQVGGLSPQNTYTFEVRAKDAAGNTGPVGSVSFTTAPPPPLAPTNLQFNQIADCAWNASWSASANATSYTVTQTNGPTMTGITGTSVIINCTAGNPSSNQPKSVQACGVSGCSSTVDFGAPVDITKPTAPTNFVLGTVYPTSVTASWTASYDLNGIASYQYTLNGGSTWIAAGASPSLSLTNLTPQTTYTISVRGLDPSNNASDPTPGVQFTTPVAPDVTKPSDVTNVHTTALQQDFITFAWDAASDNVGVVGYNYKLSSQSTWTVSGLTQSVSYSGLTQQTAYTFQIQARDGAGNLSTNITQFTVSTPAGFPSQPLNAFRVQGGSCWWNATWDPPTGPGTVTYYQVRESGTGNVKQVNAPSTSTTVNFTDSSCSDPSSNMPQWVKACNSFGCGASQAFTTR